MTEPKQRYALDALLGVEGAVLPPGGHVLLNVVSILKQSPAAAQLMRLAGFHKTSSGFDAMLDAGTGYFYPRLNHFDVGYQQPWVHKTEKGLCRTLAAFTANLRRAWQHNLGCGADRNLAPEHFLMQHRCEEADTQAALHHVAWELKVAGAQFLWRHLSSGSNGDIAVVYARAAEEDAQASHDGRALRAAFDQWFAERERLNACDAQALEILDLALLETPFAPAPARPLQRLQMQALGLMPGGYNYLAGCLFAGPWYETRPETAVLERMQDIEQDRTRLIALAEKQPQHK